MRFHRHVSEEARAFLREQLIAYKKEVVMTPDERSELHKWVAKGRSPYENGDYIYGLDFVGALRAEEERTLEYMSLSDEVRADYHAVTNSDDIICVSEFDDIDFPELPF